MKHESCKALYRYWDTLRAGGPAPARTAIEPAEISDHLRDTFILESSDGVYPFRLAGTRLCAIFGRELKSSSFLDLWAEGERDQINALLSAVAEEGHGAILGISARGRRERKIDLELLLLPLVQAGPHFDRVFGVMSPMQIPYWLGLEPLADLAITSERLLWPDGRESSTPQENLQPSIEPVADIAFGAERRRDRFVVLDGGKSG
jgi:hypothetical protein